MPWKKPDDATLSKTTCYLPTEQSLTNDQEWGRMGAVAATVFTFQTSGIVTTPRPSSRILSLQSRRQLSLEGWVPCAVSDRCMLILEAADPFISNISSSRGISLNVSSKQGTGKRHIMREGCGGVLSSTRVNFGEHVHMSCHVSISSLTSLHQLCALSLDFLRNDLFPHVPNCYHSASFLGRNDSIH